MRGPQAQMLPQCGIVTSVDSETHRAKVFLPLMQDETDWIRVGSPHVGHGWGLYMPLHVGNEVMVIFANGDLNEGHIVCSFWSEDGDQVPQEGNSFSLVHESGSVLRFNEGGKITIKAKNVAIERG